MSEPLHPTSSPGFLLWQVTLAWQRQIVAALKPFRLTHTQFVLLASTWWLTEHEQAPTQRRIAEHASTDPMMTSQVLRALEGKGLLTRQPSKRDARANSVTPTASGANLARAATAAVEAVDREFFQTTTHTEELLEALNQLAQSHQRHISPTSCTAAPRLEDALSRSERQEWHTQGMRTLSCWWPS